MINVAVIGAGAISSFHIEGYLAFPDRCRIVSVVDIDRARAERQIAWKSEGGGCTLNHAVHHIDALQWMAGLPVEVQAMFGNVAHDNAEIEDLSLAIMRFESGRSGSSRVRSSITGRTSGWYSRRRRRPSRCPGRSTRRRKNPMASLIATRRPNGRSLISTSASPR
jgi:predicted dehydrogenase